MLKGIVATHPPSPLLQNDALEPGAMGITWQVITKFPQVATCSRRSFMLMVYGDKVGELTEKEALWKTEKISPA